MICKSVSIKNFRNLSLSKAEFSPGVNVIYGDNGQGKTNLLESIYIFAASRSFRTNHDDELICFDKDAGDISIRYETSQRENEIKIKYRKGEKKKLYKNGVEISKISEFLGNFRAILFCPEHLSMIKDGPQNRRLFIDMAISQINPLYVKKYQKYIAILKQKNMLLRDAQEGKDISGTLDIWNMQLADVGAEITLERKKYISRLYESAKDFYSDIVSEKKQKEELTMHLQCGTDSDSKAEIEDFLYRRYSENTEREIKNGSTLFGPHRDDLLLFLNHKDARLFASQGQSRSIVLALKLAEGEISKEICGEYPVFLLDDILSDLDIGRQSYVLSKIAKRQVILTTCTSEYKDKFSDAKIINISGGKII
ncbi:MAG: DNA replication/repair protein RecF [Clostridia bacterium]|nr:DNA replication/repair protein RecF [Clostridia bacterium]